MTDEISAQFLKRPDAVLFIYLFFCLSLCLSTSGIGQFLGKILYTYSHTVEVTSFHFSPVKDFATLASVYLATQDPVILVQSARLSFLFEFHFTLLQIGIPQGRDGVNVELRFLYCLFLQDFSPTNPACSGCSLTCQEGLF